MTLSPFTLRAGARTRLAARTAALAFAALAATSVAQAQVVTGRLVDAFGVGVPDVDLDFKSQSGGGNPTVSHDFTDANGFFTTTITPAGTYRIEFIPPAPPISTSMYLRLDGVVIGPTTTNLGVITLPQGVAVSGRCVDSAGVPVVGVNIDAITAAGANATLVHDFTDALGSFSIAVPAGSTRLNFDTTPAVGPLHAPRTIAIDGGTQNVGDIVHPPGYLLSAIVRRQSNNAAVANVNVDVLDSATHAKLYTPDDQTDASGFVDTIVPAGVFDIRFDPPTGAGLAPLELTNQTITGTTFLGFELLQNGVILSGVVKNSAGVPQAGVDIDVEVAATGVDLYLGADTTNAAGAYSVVVPVGTYNIDVSPPFTAPLAGVSFPSVVVNANKVQNAVLPACPFFSTVGVGTPGLGGVTPQITATGGAPRIGNLDYTVHCSQGRGSAFAIVFYSMNPTPATLPSPMQPLSPMQRRVIHLDGALGVAGDGDASFALPIPDDPFFVGNLLRAWFRVRDGAAAGGLSSTNELRATICL